MKSAYGRKTPSEDAELTHVEAGTPMGELLRRHWQPLCLSSEIAGAPFKVRILCEDLVVFRDPQGRIGCLDAHCSHRGTSLEFGRVEGRGLRCCYHGWLYDTQGKCIEMPCEKPGYAERMDVWQPAYPVHEYGGVVFAYMGPPEKQPLFPMYDIIDTRDRDDVELRGMRLWDDHSIGFVRDCNWLQHYENVVDPYHLLVLHNTNSGDQFGSVITTAGWPDIRFEETSLGVRYCFFRDLPNGNRLERFTECVLPNVYLVSNIHERGDKPKVKDRCTEVTWAVPIDNEHVRGISIVAWPVRDGRPVADWKPGTDTRTSIRPGDLRNRPYAEKQRRPDDMEAQESQRPIAVHALENLALSDRGVALLRKRLRESLALVRGGQDPLNVVRDPARNRAIPTNAWNTVIAPDRASEAAE
jgi:nitrite reductase/ring-hydroxylating ferredoxin subunit